MIPREREKLNPQLVFSGFNKTTYKVLVEVLLKISRMERECAGFWLLKVHTILYCTLLSGKRLVLHFEIALLPGSTQLSVPHKQAT